MPSPQHNLHKWFSTTQPSQAQTIVPTVFYLHCNEQQYVEAKWYHKDHFQMNHKQDSLMCYESVAWNIGGRHGHAVPIDICCDALTTPHHNTSICKAILSSPQHEVFSIPYLKSHLQKCIRKGNTQNALSTAYCFIQQNRLEFIRRLSIIMVEDVELHSSFNILLWWIVALSKKPELQDNEQVMNHLTRWLLGVVNLLCQHPYRKKLDTLEECKESFPIHSCWGIVQHIHKWKTQMIALQDTQSILQNTIYSVLFRATYGGLKGDMQLLHHVANHYAHVMMQNDVFKPYKHTLQSFLYVPIDVLKDYTIQPLTKKKWDLDAVDFHIVPQLISYIQCQLLHQKTNNQPIDIQRMVWENGSSLNYRDDSKENQQHKLYAFAEWKSILPQLRKEQTRLLYECAHIVHDRKK